MPFLAFVILQFCLSKWLLYDNRLRLVCSHLKVLSTWAAVKKSFAASNLKLTEVKKNKLDVNK